MSEDIIAVGSNPLEVSDEDFKFIAQEIQEYLDQSFQPALLEALNNLRVR